MTSLPTGCQVLAEGTGCVERRSDFIRLLRSSASERVGSNAQVGDPIGVLRWRPPLTLTIRARFSHPLDRLRGTAGFGFWNWPLGPGIGGLRPPRYAWFFAGGPPHDVSLALGVPGRGFKAAVLDAQRWPFFALLPTAPLGALLMRVPALYRALWPLAQRAIGVAETALTQVDVTEFHTYTLRWDVAGVTFAIDGSEVLSTRSAPGGPLSFVAWIDNSYAIATPRGRFGFGLVAEPEAQWLDLAGVAIDR